MPEEEIKVKCVVWDLDNTIWHGVLSEGDDLVLREGVVEFIRELDRRGILQSVASRNNAQDAMSKLESFGLDEFMLYPQIHWESKSGSVRAISEKLNLGLDTFAFIDDQVFERDEVCHVHPDVRVYDPEELDGFSVRSEFMPRFLTDDARQRRDMYQQEQYRQEEQESFIGTEDAFLRSLNMTLCLSLAMEEDLQRAEELTLRTNQLNTTGVSYSYDDLKQLMESPQHILLVAGLDDRYGTYGKIGLVLVKCEPDTWVIELLLMSCRVMSRGVGGVIITWLREECASRGLKLHSRFKETDRNRMMYVTYRFAGFSEVSKEGDVALLENDLSNIPPMPDYVDLDTCDIPELQYG